MKTEKVVTTIKCDICGKEDNVVEPLDDYGGKAPYGAFYIIGNKNYHVCSWSCGTQAMLKDLE